MACIKRSEIDAICDNLHQATWAQKQVVVEGMFRQPSEYMAMVWRIERNAYAKAPTLDEYLRMCGEKQNHNMLQGRKDRG